MASDQSKSRVNRRDLLRSTGIAAAIGLAGCSSDGGDGSSDGGGDTGGDTGGDDDTPMDGDGGTPTEQGPSDRSAPYLDELPDYYPESYWRTIDGAMDESDQSMYTAFFGGWIQDTLEGFNQVIDFIDWTPTSLGTSEVYTRFTTEASRGQINPDLVYTHDPIATRQLYVAGLLENYVSPNVTETDVFPDRAITDIEGLVQMTDSYGCHTWHPNAYAEAGKDEPPRDHDLGWFTDQLEDDPDFYTGNFAKYDGVTSTSGWQQMDYYSVANGEDWMTTQYEELATGNPTTFVSTSTMGEWVANGQVAYGMGLANWIVAQFVLPDFTLGEDITWGTHVIHNIMSSNYQVVTDAENPNSAKLFSDWLLSPHGISWLCRRWGLGPTRTDISDDQLSEDPVWGVTTSAEAIQESDQMSINESIFMEFEKRTTRSDQKAKYKDQWYNLFT